MGSQGWVAGACPAGAGSAHRVQSVAGTGSAAWRGAARRSAARRAEVGPASGLLVWRARPPATTAHWRCSGTCRPSRQTRLSRAAAAGQRRGGRSRGWFRRSPPSRAGCWRRRGLRRAGCGALCKRRQQSSAGLRRAAAGVWLDPSRQLRHGTAQLQGPGRNHLQLPCVSVGLPRVRDRPSGPARCTPGEQRPGSRAVGALSRLLVSKNQPACVESGDGDHAALGGVRLTRKKRLQRHNGHLCIAGRHGGGRYGAGSAPCARPHHCMPCTPAAQPLA